MATGTPPFTGVIFMRGINVGGHRVTNSRLIELFAEAGVEDPTPYQASGNVLFRSDAPDLKKLEQSLLAALGYNVPLTIRDGNELVAIAEAEPFGTQQIELSASKPQVILLLEGSPDHKAVEASSTDDNPLVAGDRHVFWLPHRGVSEAKFDQKQMQAAFGPNTVRTQGTIQRLVKKLG